MRLCVCGAPTPLGRANRFGVRMPAAYCGNCKPKTSDRRDHHYRSPITVGPATCSACQTLVWYDRIAGRWIEDDRRIHSCGAVWITPVDKGIDGRRTVTHRKGAEPSSPAPRTSLRTDAVRNTGYTSRQSQARSSDRTGTSGVDRSRTNAAGFSPRTHENPRPDGLGDDGKLPTQADAVTTDLGALSLR